MTRVRYLAFLSLAFLLTRPVLAHQDSYDVILKSESLTDQRAALNEILKNPQEFAPRLRQSLQEYPQLLRTDPKEAKRAVYLSALLRDPSLAPLLVKSLSAPEVLDDCLYACPAVFALAVQTHFGGWKLPSNLDAGLATVSDLKREVKNLSRMSLRVGSITDVAQGPGIDKIKRDFDAKTEEELIQLAGPTTESRETRALAAFRLETLVSTSKNRIDLYLLALNDFDDASGEYRGAIYQAIYRAELAKAQGK